MKMGESPREVDKKPPDNNNQITQNIKDLLASREIENIFENSDFIYMLNQASGDRQILAKQLNISLLDSELRETQTTNYFSVFQRIDRAVWELMAD